MRFSTNDLSKYIIETMYFERFLIKNKNNQDKLGGFFSKFKRKRAVQSTEKQIN